jgi:hypothetical protein
MTRILELNRASAINAATLVPVWNESDTQAMTLQLLQSYMQGNLTFTGLQLASQYAAPSATGFNIAVSIADTWLILTPTAGFAAGTITLPANPGSKQQVRVSCTQAVTTLTVAGNGKSVSGAPATLAANAFFTLMFDSVLNSWFRIG